MLKQLILIRTDLNMGKGKLAAQCGHAILAAYKKAITGKETRSIAENWEREGAQKVVLKVASEAELHAWHQRAKDAGIPCSEIIHDAGHTQIAPGTATCFATLPWAAEKLDAVFGSLKLL